MVRPLLVLPSPGPDTQSDGERYAGTVLEMLQRGSLCYIDAAECCSRDLAVSLTADNRTSADLAEVHPVLMLGIAAACIPLLQWPLHHASCL